MKFRDKIASLPGPFVGVIAVVITLAIAEGLLRFVLSVTPGSIADNKWFHYVNQLQMREGFYADSLGIFKVSAVSATEIEKAIRANTLPNNLINFSRLITNLKIPEQKCKEVYALSLQYCFTNSHFKQNAFSHYIDSIQNIPPQLYDGIDSAILRYTYCPINRDGFRSIDFCATSHKRKKILILGDSFAWGHTTSIITNSFADILLTKGYAVYNTGISGADPAQYLAVAKAYIPLIKPDIVIVNFFMGNDITYYKRPVLPHLPILYSTNAGNLYSFYNGMLFSSASQIYSFIYESTHIPCNNIAGKICAKSAIGTLIWRTFYKSGFVKLPYTRNKYERYTVSEKYEKPYSNVELDSIRSLTEQSGAKFILSVIPDIQNDALKDPRNTPYLFENLKYSLFPAKKELYNMGDGHFNDKGHMVYANFLDSIIKSSFK
jgi:hypothetical protein